MLKSTLKISFLCFFVLHRCSFGLCVVQLLLLWICFLIVFWQMVRCINTTHKHTEMSSPHIQPHILIVIWLNTQRHAHTNFFIFFSNTSLASKHLFCIIINILLLNQKHVNRKYFLKGLHQHPGKLNFLNTSLFMGHNISRLLLIKPDQKCTAMSS